MVSRRTRLCRSMCQMAIPVFWLLRWQKRVDINWCYLQIWIDKEKRVLTPIIWWHSPFRQDIARRWIMTNVVTLIFIVFLNSSLFVLRKRNVVITFDKLIAVFQRRRKNVIKTKNIGLFYFDAFSGSLRLRRRNTDLYKTYLSQRFEFRWINMFNNNLNSADADAKSHRTHHY